jgi:hypothetical protein
MSGAESNLSGRGWTVRDAQEFLDRERAEWGRQNAAVGRLRGDAAFARLDGATLHGRTGEQWSTALGAMGTARSRLEKWRRALAEIGQVLAVPNIDDDDLTRIRDLFGRHAVALDADEIPAEHRPPPWANSDEQTYGLASVRDWIKADERDARRVVERVAAVWAAAEPRLTRAAEAISVARQRSLDGSGDVTEATLGTLARSLDEITAIVRGDPLALLSGDPAAGPDTVDLSRLDRLEGQLVAVAGLPAPRSARVPAEADGLREEWERLRARVTAYQMRAAKDGYVEEPELVRRHREATRLLAAGPGALRAAEAAVARYIDRVWEIGRARP